MIKIKNKSSRWFRCFSFLWLNLSLTMSSLESLPPESSTKTHKLSIASIFKNEAKHLKEWIEYHKMVGVDHFYLYNSGSADRYRAVLAPYIAKGTVTYVDWSGYMPQQEGNDYIWALSAQIPAYENAKLRAQSQTKWLVFLDVEEFLVPVGANALTDILEKYDADPGVFIESDYFSASKEIIANHTKKICLESLVIANPPEKKVQRSVKKTIFKPDQCEYFYWPPYEYSFKNQQVAHKLDKGEIRINHYVNRHQNTPLIRTQRKKLKASVSLLSKDDIRELINEGYEIEDTEQVTSRFIPELIKRVGY